MANKPLPEPPQWPTTGGAMADRIRAFDWERTPLGPTARWPQSLRTTIDILLASGHAMQLAWGPERTILYNDAYAPMLGERHPDALGLSLREAWPEIWGEIEPLVDQVFAGETVCFDDMPLTMTRNGHSEETWWTFSYSPVRDESGAVAGLLNVTIDATPKVLGKQIEAALRESDTRHRLLVGSWAQAVWETNEAGVVVADSPSWRTYTGQTLEEWLGDGWLGAVHPDDRAYAERQWWEAIASRSLVNAEFRLCVPDGEFRWTNVRAAPVIDAEGRVEKWVGMNIDIDDRKRLEGTLHESEERQAFLLKLSDALRPIGAPIAVQEAAARLACEEMQADRCYYAEFDWPGDVLHIHHECVRFGAVSAVGRHPISAVQDLLQFSREGRPLVCDNIATHPTFKSEIDAYRARGTDGFILVPLVKGGVMVACMCVTMETPRAWTQAEVALAEEVAERTWAAVERARAEEATRESESWLAAQKEALQQALGGARLEDTLAILSRATIEMIDHGARCAFYLADGNLTALRHVAGMPESYARRVDGFVIGPDSLACGLATATGEPVITRDVRDEPRWRKWLPLAEEYGYRACWSFPLETATGRAVGTLALYFAEPREPTPGELEKVAMVTRTAAIIISRHQEAEERALAEAALRGSEARLRGALAIETVGATFWDPVRGYALTETNDAFLRIIGQNREAAAGTTAMELTAPEFHAALKVRLAEAERTGVLAPYEKQIVRADGTRCWVLGAGRMVEGELFEFILDVDERHRATDALRASEERLRQFGEASQDVLWIRDAETLQWQYLTPAFETIYGLSRDETLAGDNYGNWLDLIVPEDRERALEGIARVRAGKHATFEFRIKRPSDGTTRWMRNTDFPITDASGKVVLIGGIGHDATDLKRAQERQDTLLAELQHRVRNILAVTRSIVSRSNDGERDTEGYVQHLQGRISALARTQVLLTRQAGTGVDLEDLIRDELLAQAASEQQFALAGPEVRLSAKAAEVLTLAIHELATNATKYGAFSRTAGRLDIRWSVETRDAQNWLVLDWTERGIPIVDTAPRRRGFGAELVSRRIPYELKGHGQFELRPGGLQSHIEFPLVAGDSILQTDGVSR